MRPLNNLYLEAEKLGGQSYLEGCLACLTAYTIFLCMETHYEKVRLALLPVGGLMKEGYSTYSFLLLHWLLECTSSELSL